jgi:hypothetical protein
MSMQYIRDYYRLPVKVGDRVTYWGGTTAREGTVVGARGQYLRVRLDGDKHPSTMHPTWRLDYFDGPR